MKKKTNTTVMQARDMKKVSSGQRLAQIGSKTLTYGFLLIMVLIVIFPFYWMIISSVKTLDEYQETIPTFWPQKVEWFHMDSGKAYVTFQDNLTIDEKGKVVVNKETGKAEMTDRTKALKVGNIKDGVGEEGYYFMDTGSQPQVGNDVILLGTLSNKDGMAYMEEGQVQKRIPTMSARGETLTVEEAIAKAASMEPGTTTQEVYYVTGVLSEVYHEKWTPLPLNYATAFNTAGLGRLFGNTLYVGVISTLLSLVITVLSAFAFARLEFKGKNALFAALLATMMIPGELFTITNYITVNNLKWMNSFKALIVPFLVSVFYIYLLKQNFMQIPNELYLAAKVDGCGDLKYLWKVMIPLSLPTLISITILKMMGAWNSYIWPKLVANDEAHELITNGLRNAFASVDGSSVDIPKQMAAVAIVSAPLFLVFLFLRKYIMAGVSRSGIKG